MSIHAPLKYDEFEAGIMPLRREVAEIKAATIALHRQRRHSDEPAERFVKSCILRALMRPGETLDAAWRNRFVSRAATNLATTSAPAWAGQLSSSDFLAFLASEPGPRLLPQLLALGLSAPLIGGFGSVPYRSDTTIGGAWVGEGGALPVEQFALAALPMQRRKVGGLSVLSLELIQTPGSEGVVGSLLREDIGRIIDRTLIGTDPASAVQPAGILYGVTPIAAGTSPIADLQAIASAVLTGGGKALTLIMNPVQALGLADLARLPPILESYEVPPGRVIGLDAGSFVGLVERVSLDVSDEALLVMRDDAGQVVGDPSPPPALTDVGTPVRSLWQTAARGLRVLADADWALPAGRVAYVDSVAW